MASDETLLDANQAAPLIKVAPKTLYDWAKKGVFPHIRILADKKRPVIRFRRSDIEQFLKDRTQNA